MIFGLIIAAGKQSRFKQEIPKCLASINDTCILNISIDNMSKYCDEVFVVCSNENKDYFTKYNYIAIESGKGSGDAILSTIDRLLVKYNISSNDSLIIQWGDALVDEHLYSLLKHDNNECVIPCVYEEKPYVQLVEEANHKVRVNFSKYKDKITSGYHDMCVFACNLLYLYTYLSNFFIKFSDINNNCYNHKHGNEFEFLDVFNDTNCNARIIPIDESFSTKSFNTIEELKSFGGTI